MIPAPGAGLSFLSLTTGGNLLRALESKEWGRPLALGTVIVGTNGLDSVRFGVSEADLVVDRMKQSPKSV